VCVDGGLVGEKKMTPISKRLMVIALLFLPATVLSAHDGVDGRFFTNDENGQDVVYDPLTRITWQATSVTTTDWKAALAYCQALSYAGHDDWRLPNINEIMSLIDIDEYQPASHFPSMPSTRFWSSSSCQGDSDESWSVHFETGVVEYEYKVNSADARCIR